jgi:sugar/nucleoside kinase (ribokinase family)
LGVVHEQALIASGVTVHLRQASHLRTGCTVVLVDETGERTMYPDRGANSALRTVDIPEMLFRTATHLHVSGYSLLNESTRPAALAAIALARERRLSWSVDPASASLLMHVGPHRFRDWTRGATLCFPNLDEGMVLTGKQDAETIESELSQDYRVLVLKLGADGARVVANGTRIEAPSGSLESTEVVDTTGAGDAFCAAFLATWARQDSLREALERASAAAGRAVARVGARQANAVWRKLLEASPSVPDGAVPLKPSMPSAG